jgi:indolepyruvate decarboxylase
MAFPADLADQPVVSTANPLPPPTSDPASLDAACAAILAALDEAKSACILAGGLLSRLGASESLRALVDASGLPLTTMFMDKSVLDERHPFYLGMYNGALMNETVRDFVENCDIILSLGAPMTDLSSGAFTARLDPDRTIVVNHHSVQVKGKTYISVEIDELVQKLVKRCGKQRDWKRLSAASLGPIIGAGNTAISAEALYPRWECFLKENDMLFAESGTVSMGLGFALMPKGANFYNQTLLASIGWATPASFGAAVAAPQRRVVLITGEGAHQMTAQEISQFARFGLKPVIFVLNNNGYLIERLLCRTPDIAYNDIAQWRYAELPRALGCEGWFCARVATCEEFDTALKKAEDFPSGVYIEIVTDTYAASPMALKLHDSMKSLYKS